MRFQQLAWCSVMALLTSCSAEVHPTGSGSDSIDPGDTGGGVGGSLTDPCAGVELPQCPPKCPADGFQRCGEACAEEGEACGNEIGDGMRCTEGVWQCTVHPPLGTGCNLVCRPGPA